MTSQVKFLNYDFEVIDLAGLISKLKSGEFINQSLHFIAASSFYGHFDGLRFSEIWDDGILISDSRPLSFYLRLKNRGFSQIRGTDFMRDFLTYHPSRSFLIGGNAEIASEIKLKYERANPQLDIVGSIHSDFSRINDLAQLEHCARLICESDATTVWIGLGSPKQDYIAQQLSLLIKQPVIAVGAAFDFLSHQKPEAPKLITKFYLEWFYRFIKEPSRLWKRYLVGNVNFLYLILRDLFIDLLKKYQKPSP